MSDDTDEKPKKKKKGGKARKESLAAKGGKARANALTPERKREIASAAASARWAATADTRVPTRLKATHEGELQIGTAIIPCAVLSNGQRVLTQRGFLKAIGRHEQMSATAEPDDGGEPLPPFLASKSLKPFVSEALIAASRPINFNIQGARGSSRAYGYPAELLPRVCQVYLMARDAGALPPNQAHIAKACDILIRGMAMVGIIALVDEATGFQYERDRNELHKILEAFVAKELLPWTQRFPDEFYKQMFRLRGWAFSPLLPTQGPRYAGKLTNELVYERLPDGVLDELRARNPTDDTGRRRHRHHQYLTIDIGNPYLERHVSAVTALMRAATNWNSFQDLFKRAFPAKGEQLPLDLPAPTETPPDDE
jgi:hypothetical protein